MIDLKCQVCTKIAVFDGTVIPDLFRFCPWCGRLARFQLIEQERKEFRVLEKIVELDPGLWKTAQQMADNAIKENADD